MYVRNIVDGLFDETHPVLVVLFRLEFEVTYVVFCLQITLDLEIF